MYYTYNFNVEYCFKIIVNKVPFYFYSVLEIQYKQYVSV